MKASEKQVENIIATRNVENGEEEIEEIIPENARPFQALDFSRKDPFTLEEALEYFEEDSSTLQPKNLNLNGDPGFQMISWVHRRSHFWHWFNLLEMKS